VVATYSAVVELVDESVNLSHFAADARVVVVANVHGHEACFHRSIGFCRTIF